MTSTQVRSIVALRVTVHRAHASLQLYVPLRRSSGPRIGTYRESSPAEDGVEPRRVLQRGPWASHLPLGTARLRITGRRAAQFGRRRPNWPGRTNHTAGVGLVACARDMRPPSRTPGGRRPRWPARGRAEAASHVSSRLRVIWQSDILRATYAAVWCRGGKQAPPLKEVDGCPNARLRSRQAGQRIRRARAHLGRMRSRTTPREPTKGTRAAMSRDSNRLLTLAPLLR